MTNDKDQEFLLCSIKKKKSSSGMSVGLSVKDIFISFGSTWVQLSASQTKQIRIKMKQLDNSFVKKKIKSWLQHTPH